MKTELTVVVILCLSVVAAELVYPEFISSDQSKRNFDLGLPETLEVKLRHSGEVISLSLRENQLLNANAPIYEPMTDKNGNTRIQRNLNIKANNKVRYYQDRANGAFITAECMKRESGPCARLLSGNLVVNGKEHKIEPAVDALETRELPSHLGTPHRMEPLTREYRFGGISEHQRGGKIMTAVREDKWGDDYLTYKPPEETTAPTTTEDFGETEEEREHEKLVAREFLLEKLLERLSRDKRQTSPTAHGVEMLMAIDHAVYNEFATRYSGDENIKYKIREYYSHIINGVDLRYASIQENDISIYVTISGFYISNDVSQSPWMDYSQNPTDGSSGLSNMIPWRGTQGLPPHDHACLITGTNIQSGGNQNVVGIAYLDGVCKDHRVSINEEMGFFKGSGVLAHELGHNLGAYHDSGSAGSSCDPNSDYVMAPYVPYVGPGTEHIEPWRFSSCSINEFRGYFNGLGSSDCTLNRAVIYNETEFNKHTEGLAGQLYSVSEQCVLLRGDDAQFCGDNQNTADVCRNLRCNTTTSSCGTYVAAHGTPCGNNLMCFEGLCNEPIDGNRTTSRPTNPPTPRPTTPAGTTPGATTPPVSCDETFSELTGVIRSPNYPDPYPNDRQCVYLISQPEGHKITLTFSFFDVEGSGCQFDYLEVRDGDSDSAPIIGFFCGPDMPPDVTSSGNSLHIKFVTDGSVQNLGFEVSYKAEREGGYRCIDEDVGEMTCRDIRSLMGPATRMCAKFYSSCCQYCYKKNACKKDRTIRAATKMECAEIVTALGLEQTCIMFPYECCITCQELATGGR